MKEVLNYDNGGHQSLTMIQIVIWSFLFGLSNLFIHPLSKISYHRDLARTTVVFVFPFSGPCFQALVSFLFTRQPFCSMLTVSVFRGGATRRVIQYVRFANRYAAALLNVFLSQLCLWPFHIGRVCYYFLFSVEYEITAIQARLYSTACSISLWWYSDELPVSFCLFFIFWRFYILLQRQDLLKLTENQFLFIYFLFNFRITGGIGRFPEGTCRILDL